MSDEELVTISPESNLKFKLQRNSPVKTILTVTNRSARKVLFKVKTTHPNWYFVKPSQAVLDAGQSEEVQITVVSEMASNYLDQLDRGDTEEKLEKHRFLVQSRAISDADYVNVLSNPLSQRIDAMNALWVGNNNQVKKISVEYEILSGDALLSTSSQRDNPELRSRLSNTPAGLTGGASLGISSVSESEIASLRKKYDAVVEYTVRLTADRDELSNQLDRLSRDLQKEKRKGSGDRDGTGMGRTTEKKADRGFSLLMVIVIALISFLIGRFTS